MSVAIIGGNERMEQHYIDVCKSHNCKVKVFTKPKGIREKIGNPDVVIFFTNTVSHKMTRQALSSIANSNPTIIRSHSSSISSLKEILNKHFAQ